MLNYNRESAIVGEGGQVHQTGVVDNDLRIGDRKLMLFSTMTSILLQSSFLTKALSKPVTLRNKIIYNCGKGVMIAEYVICFI